MKLNLICINKIALRLIELYGVNKFNFVITGKASNWSWFYHFSVETNLFKIFWPDNQVNDLLLFCYKIISSIYFFPIIISIIKLTIIIIYIFYFKIFNLVLNPSVLNISQTRRNQSIYNMRKYLWSNYKHFSWNDKPP